MPLRNPNQQVLYIGEYREFAMEQPPAGWLFCDFSAISREYYFGLFLRIGTRYGAGNGSTTFNLPDRRSRGSLCMGQAPGHTNRILGEKGGSEFQVLSAGNMPSHGHNMAHGHNIYGETGANGTNEVAGVWGESYFARGSYPGLIAYDFTAPHQGHRHQVWGYTTDQSSTFTGSAGSGQSFDKMQPFITTMVAIYTGMP